MLTKNQQNNLVIAYSKGFKNFLNQTNQNLNSYYEESKILHTLIQNHQKWITIWLQWPRNKVEKFFKVVLKRFFSKHWINLFNLILNDGYLIYLESILNQIKQHIAELLNIKMGSIYTVFSLDQNQITKITKAITNYLNCDVELKNYLDQELIGGVLVKVGNHSFDNSINHQLKTLKKTITIDYEN